MKKQDALLDGLVTNCASYWLKGADDILANERVRLEAEIKTAIPHVLSWASFINIHYGKVPDAVRHTILDLQDACTGGSFETKGRKADHRRYLKIANLTQKLERELHELKPSVWRLLPGPWKKR